MTTRRARYVVVVNIAVLLTALAFAQEPSPPPASTQNAPPHNNIRKAIHWKQFDYTCEGGAKLTVYLANDMAKIRFGEHAYLMKQTVSADGNRYSDGKVVWWGKGEGGFLQEDAADGNGKMILKDCKLVPGPKLGSVTGTVSYLQRMALPPSAVIEVQLVDISLADAPAKVVAEERINLGQRQVPIPFELQFETAKVDEKHSYSVSAKITVDGALRFITDKSYPVLTRGNPTRVDLILKQVAAAQTP